MRKLFGRSKKELPKSNAAITADFLPKGTENVKLVETYKNSEINAPEQETAARRAHRQKVARIYTAMLKTNKRIVKTALVAMQPFMNDFGFQQTLTPYEHFEMFQFFQTVREIRGRISKHLLDHEDFRDHMENMYCLYQDFGEMKAAEGARRLAEDVKDFLKATGDFIEKLEFQSEHAVTNWLKVAALFEINSEADAPTDYIPDIAWLQPPEMVLGVGGFGSVFLCRLRGGPKISVKLVRKDRFKDENYSAAGKIVGAFLNSPHLCRAFSSFSTQDCYVTIMEFIDGVDLHKVCRTLKGIPLEHLRILVAQLCMAVRYLHYKGFIHRDIKPMNVMVKSGTRLKLIDFDTAKICIGKFSPKVKFKSFFRRTAREFWDRRAPGTVVFMPPEVLTGSAYGRATDWWAVGVSLFYMYTCALPFSCDEQTNIKLSIIENEHTWPEEVDPPANLADCVKKFLIKKSCDRLGSGSYAEIEQHPFFESVNWVAWETGAGVNEWPELDEVISKKNELLKDIEAQKSEKIVRLEEQIPAEYQLPVYTFSTAGFRHAIEKLRSNLTLSEDQFEDELEYLKDVPQPYMFHKYLESRKK